MNKPSLSKIKLSIICLLTTLCLSACSTTPENNKQSAATDSVQVDAITIANDSLDTIINALIDISAHDFYEHQVPLPLAFRGVEIKYLTKSAQEKQFILCGQFLTHEGTANTEKWTDFTTIKNSAYEQWIGANALAYKQDAKAIANKTIDLPVALKSRLDALQQK